MEPFAVPSDIVAVWRPLTPAEETTAPGLLMQASQRIRFLGREAGIDIDEKIADDELLTDMVKTAVVNAVIRVLKNPGGLRQFQRSTTSGPFTDSEGGTYDTTIAAGLLYFTADDLLGILPVDDGKGWVGTARLGMGLA